ncbi:hypothetical protein STEG23_038433, partial [Scotinomys teguina]
MLLPAACRHGSGTPRCCCHKGVSDDMSKSKLEPVDGSRAMSDPSKLSSYLHGLLPDLSNLSSGKFSTYTPDSLYGSSALGHAVKEKRCYSYLEHTLRESSLEDQALSGTCLHAHLGLVTSGIGQLELSLLMRMAWGCVICRGFKTNNKIYWGPPPTVAINEAIPPSLI